MSEPVSPKQLMQMLADLFDGRLSAEQRDRLRELIQCDQTVRDAYIEQMMTHALLEWRHGVGRQRSESEETESLLMEVIEQERAARIKREAEEALQQQQAEEEENRRRESWARMMGISEDKPIDVRKRFVIPTPVFYGGIAALLAVVLWVGWAAVSSMTRQESQDFVDNTSQPPVVIERPVVATLIHTLDAVWAERHVQVRAGEAHAPVPLQGGADLREGDKYTLTQGLAQLETNRGAIVVLEAPCEIQLLGENAVRLSHGKLVGKCLTLESKGFTVATPAARIVDLGTEFGVAVRQAGQTQVAVFDGEVELHAGAEQAGDSHATQRLTSGQAARVEPDTQRIVAVEADRRVAFQRTVSTSPYEQVVLADSPLIFWRFNEPAGSNEARDTGSLAAHAKRTGDATTFGVRHIGTQRLGTAIEMNGATGGLDSGVHPVLRQPTQLTIETWLRLDPKPDNHPEQHEVVISNRGTQSGEGGFLLGVERNARWSGTRNALQFSWPMIADWYATENPLVVGEWTHVAVTMRGTDIRMYINGRAVHAKRVDSFYARQSVEDGILPSTAPLAIGCNPAEQVAFLGAIDEMAVFDKALDADRIAAHYAAGRR